MASFTSTLSATKIEAVIRTQLVYPEAIVELLEQLYQKNMTRFIDKQNQEFNFMRIGFDTTETIRLQYTKVFPTWRELNNKFDSKFCYLAQHEVSEFKLLFKILKCLTCLQQLIRLHNFTGNPVHIDYDTYCQLRFFWNNDQKIREIIYG